MKRIISGRIIYLLCLIIIILLGSVIVPTFAKFEKIYTTTNDVVGFSLNFDLSINNIEEYEEIKVEANSYEVFNIHVTNSTGALAYYGIWYKMVSPKEKTDDIVIAKLEENTTMTTGSIDSNGDITVSIIIKNNSKDRIVVNIGVGSSSTGTNDIEYLGGKYLITESIHEVDYYYDDATSKYISTGDSNVYFTDSATNYDYTGSSQTFTASHEGVYKLEAWGASGGDMSGTGIDASGNSRGDITYLGGRGAYTVGSLNLSKDESLYVYVGGQGLSNVSFAINEANIIGGYNGGGGLVESRQTMFGGTGGGATDFRLTSGSWDDATSLSSRIMVAAGGGSANFRNEGYGEGAGGDGGTVVGGNGHEALTPGSYFREDYGEGYTIGLGATQIAPGRIEQHLLNGNINILENYFPAYDEIEFNPRGGFGFGGVGQSGGGSGYYGGCGASHGGAAGGSSYVSGYTGCVAITSASDTTPKSGCTDGTTDIECSYHYSGKRFKNPIMIGGDASMPTHDGTTTMTGNSGNGYAKITPIVPLIDSSSIVVTQGSELDVSTIKCIDRGSGCKVVRTSYNSSFAIGNHSIDITVMDHFGFVYRYTRNCTVVKNAEKAKALLISESEILATVSGRTFTKVNNVEAITGFAYFQVSTGEYNVPILVSTNQEAVIYTTSYSNTPLTSQGNLTYLGQTYYYSNAGEWMNGDFSTDLAILNSDTTRYTSLEEAIQALLDDYYYSE